MRMVNETADGTGRAASGKHDDAMGGVTAAGGGGEAATPCSRDCSRTEAAVIAGDRRAWPGRVVLDACVVTVVDRVLQRAELVVIEGESYRLREAQERQHPRTVARPCGKQAPTTR